MRLAAAAYGIRNLVTSVVLQDWLANNRCCRDVLPLPLWSPAFNSECRERIDEDVVIFFGFIVQIVAAHAEIERAVEIRGQPKLLVQLPGMFVGQIFRDKPVAATQLRIAEYRRSGNSRIGKNPAVSCTCEPVSVQRGKVNIPGDVLNRL